MKVAIYARVSTDDKDQNPETQLLPLRKYAEVKGWEVYREYIDQASARDFRGRKAWRDMVIDANRGKFQAFAILRLNRAFRSVADMYQQLDRMNGCEMVSITESIDTSTNYGRLLRNILASLAEFELDQIRENVKLGLDRAKSQGKRLGRPPGSKDKRQRKKTGYYLRHGYRREDHAEISM
jgi:DNA invertase Pin-like site-specific DNA recombinase